MRDLHAEVLAHRGDALFLIGSKSAVCNRLLERFLHYGEDFFLVDRRLRFVRERQIGPDPVEGLLLIARELLVNQGFLQLVTIAAAKYFSLGFSDRVVV